MLERLFAVGLSENLPDNVDTLCSVSAAESSLQIAGASVRYQPIQGGELLSYRCFPVMIYCGFDGKFVSPVVSPGRVKMGRFLIIRDDGNNYSRYSDTAVCALLTTSANSCENDVLALGNLRFIR